MYNFVIALFLIHGCHHGIGLPVVQEISPLGKLANSCENSFLSDIIRKKGDNCKINGSVTSQGDLDCYMFFDINTQLCSAFQHSDYNLQENYETRMKERQNVATLCESAKSWKFTTINNNSPYSVLQKIINDEVNCQKLCGVNSIMSDDANYYCVYFKWGADVLQSLPPPQDTNLVAPVVVHTDKVDASAPSGNTTNAGPSAVKLESKPVESKLAKPDENTEVVHQDKPKQENPPTLTENQTSGGEKASDIVIPARVEPSTDPVKLSSERIDIDHPAVEEGPMLKKDDETINLKESKDQVDDEKEKLEGNAPEDDENLNDDYEQHEEPPLEKNNKIESVGAGESDPGVKSLTETKINGNPHAKLESVTYPPQRVSDIFPNGIDSFTDDDDHFFPIFLTGIIIVVLLYILYHNKSKFTKVILGLIVEGRQSGRRRNSRGHTYRRLDTLEQAMSSSSAAPPSKIIY